MITITEVIFGLIKKSKARLPVVRNFTVNSSVEVEIYRRRLKRLAEKEYDNVYVDFYTSYRDNNTLHALMLKSSII